MTREEFQALVKDAPVILDGATGTNLQRAGMAAGDCPERWMLENPQVVVDLQRRYVEAGTKILFAPTFTSNRIKLGEYGMAEKLVSINHELVSLSKLAAGERAFVAGDMTMTGRQLYPLGDMMFEELVEVYREQAQALYDAGVDLFVVETMMSLQECRAAVLAIREVCELPIMVSLTYREDGRTLYGTDPVTAVVTLQSLGADAVGLNCSTGPEAMLEPVARMAEYATVPVLAKPNAGLPELENGVTVYNTTPEEFAAAGKKLVEAGAAIVGGCCGTTPEHILRLCEMVSAMKVQKPLQQRRRVLTSEQKYVEITLDGNFVVIGERINPTGKKKLQAELKNGSLELVRSMAAEQEENGAQILDINMGMNGIDEKAMMLSAIYEVTSAVDAPLCIDSSHIDIIEAALRIYPGRALINSISLEKEKIEKLLPIAKKYGAMFILLPLSDAGLPKNMAEKKEIIQTILAAAQQIGMAKEDIVVDGLVTAIGANPKAALECFETFSYCKKELELPTVCGLSNISFGLPERSYINTAFLTMAIANGLTMAIANPSQELLMNAAFASDMLLDKEESDIRYIDRMNTLTEKYMKMERTSFSEAKSPAVSTQDKTDVKRKEAPGTASDADRAAKGAGGTADMDRAVTSSAGETQAKSGAVYQAVLKGKKGSILDEVKALLAAGTEPGEIINAHLIPAINEVGELFDRKKYFLPQLIASANTMKTAIEYLEPMLKREDSEEKATIVVATVEGDIHDIGKNLVVLMLKNYGYRVIDLGKDVSAEEIIDTAIRENAAVIGLSALMTTTMMRMKEVVELAKEKGCTGKIIIGGAATTESFAEEIGADGYSKDAAECVRLVEHLLEVSDHRKQH